MKKLLLLISLLLTGCTKYINVPVDTSCHGYQLVSLTQKEIDGMRKITFKRIMANNQVYLHNCSEKKK